MRGTWWWGQIEELSTPSKTLTFSHMNCNLLETQFQRGTNTLPEKPNNSFVIFPWKSNQLLPISSSTFLPSLIKKFAPLSWCCNYHVTVTGTLLFVGDCTTYVEWHSLQTHVRIEICPGLTTNFSLVCCPTFWIYFQLHIHSILGSTSSSTHGKAKTQQRDILRHLFTYASLSP